MQRSYRPFFFAHLAKIVNETSELHPVFVRMNSSDSLSRLVSMDGVWKSNVGITLIHERVQ